MTTSSITLRRKSTWTRPVSRKFYQYIRQQIMATVAVSPDLDQSYLLDLFDYYLEHGRLRDDTYNIARIIFSLITPQIDKAIVRSRRAREAAMRRREVQQHTESHEPTQSTEAAPSQSEKRIQRRQEAIERRRLKHQKRLERRMKHDATPKELYVGVNT